MFKNFFKVTVRSLLKSKLFVFINIIGLGLALACCVVAYLNYNFNSSFDKQHENFDELYQISMMRDYNGAKYPLGVVPMPLAARFADDLPGIKAYSRFEAAGITVKKNNNIFSRRMAFVDDDFLDMFTFPLKYGSKENLKELSSVMISDRVAISLFGKDDVVGETLEILVSGKPNLLLTVGGVFEQPGLQSSMQFQMLSHFENYHRYLDVEKGDWTKFVDGLFIQSDDPTVMNTVPPVFDKYKALQNEARKDILVASIWLAPMADVATNQRDINSTNLGAEALNVAQIIAPNVMAVMILLLACFNFTNTAIAMSNKRLKEIGIRKTVGGSRQQLVFQFLGENLLLCFLSLVIGLLFANWLVPKYSDMWPNMDLLMTLRGNPELVIFLTSVLLGTALLAGGYPALFVSRFKPVAILRGTLRVGSSSILSKVLLSFQFMISVSALIFGFSFLQNSAYQTNLDQGYDKESMILMPMQSASEAITMKAAIAQNPSIRNISLANDHIGWGGGGATVKSADQEVEVTVMDVGMGYTETAGVTVVQGRLFNEQNRETDRQGGILINEKMAAQFGWDDPVGKQVTRYDSIRYTVVGVLKDFYVFGFWGEIDPVMMRLRNDDELSMVIASVDPDKLGEFDDYMAAKWSEVIPDRPSNVIIHKQDVLGEAREVNEHIVTIFMFLSVIAVILSAIGLFTLVSINIQSRTKEIGVRKVLGASIPKITALINRPFLIIVGIGSILGAALAYFFTGSLMDMIWTYHMQVNALSIIIPIALILLISFLSISTKVVKAARRNPVESLRYE
ncbi:MAG: ABC transporter permease [Roseivirga sp.]